MVFNIIRIFGNDYYIAIYLKNYTIVLYQTRLVNNNYKIRISSFVYGLILITTWSEQVKPLIT